VSDGYFGDMVPLVSGHTVPVITELYQKNDSKLNLLNHKQRIYSMILAHIKSK